MTIFPARPAPAPTQLASARSRYIAVVRAVAAVLWAVVLLAVLHGRLVPTDSDMPLPAGLLLAGYPLIDAAALLWDRPAALRRRAPYVPVAIDGIAVLGLLGAALTLHADSAVVAFGVWAVASGAYQFGHAWRTGTSRRVQLPLIISGATSAVAGFSFVAMAAQRNAHLANLGGYAILGAVFFVVWTVLDRGKNK